jgi:hypothetical protein
MEKTNKYLFWDKSFPILIESIGMDAMASHRHGFHSRKGGGMEGLKD